MDARTGLRSPLGEWSQEKILRARRNDWESKCARAGNFALLSGAEPFALPMDIPVGAKKQKPNRVARRARAQPPIQKLCQRKYSSRVEQGSSVRISRTIS